MSGDIRWPLAEALAVALHLKAKLAPACIWIEVAGSIRRQRPDPADIELLCIPKPSDNLFYTDALDEAVKALMWIRPPILAVRPGIKGITTYGPKNKLLIHMPSGISLDLFSTDAKNFGMALVVRTGSRDFCVKVMSRLRQLHMRGHAYGGITSSSGEEIDCPDELVVFKNLGWPYIPPEERK